MEIRSGVVPTQEALDHPPSALNLSAPSVSQSRREDSKHAYYRHSLKVEGKIVSMLTIFQRTKRVPYLALPWCGTAITPRYYYKLMPLPQRRDSDGAMLGRGGCRVSRQRGGHPVKPKAYCWKRVAFGNQRQTCKIIRGLKCESAGRLPKQRLARRAALGPETPGRGRKRQLPTWRVRSS